MVAATHCDLTALVREDRFRADLFYRLNGGTIRVPPLRERKDDIRLLAQTFLARMFPMRKARPVLHPCALDCLRDYHWPGNVRQLQKVLCRAAGVCRGQQILPEDLDFGDIHRTDQPAAESPGQTNSNSALRCLVEAAWHSGQPDLWPHLQEHLQKELLAFALAQPGISQVALARRLGMSRNYLRGRLEHFGFTESASDIDCAE